jgi:two-component system response regulator NreC
MSIRIMIVDDHQVVRAGMRMMLESQPDLEIVGECANGEEALQQVEELNPDVIVMDVTMPGMNGIEATRLIKQKMPQVAVLAMTIHEGSDYFFQMLQAGASGYVPKRVASTDLIQAIRVVASGQVYLEPSVATALVGDYLDRVKEGSEQDSYDGLTAREREVLTLIAQDKNNQEIANLLTISVKTVERHRENIMSKLELHSRTELVKYAIRKGLINLNDEDGS